MIIDGARSCLSKFGSLVAIVFLPPVAFFAERLLDEPLTVALLPSMLTLYAFGVLAYVVVATTTKPKDMILIAAGVLAAGCAVALTIAIVATIPALLILSMSLPWQTPPRPPLSRAIDFGLGLSLCLIALSPWATFYSLAQASRTTVLAYRRGIVRTVASIGLGICLVVGAMISARRADVTWLAPRIEAFERDDISSWEQKSSRTGCAAVAVA